MEKVRDLKQEENVELRMLRAELNATRLEAQAVIKRMEDDLNTAVAKIQAEREGGELRVEGQNAFALYAPAKKNGKKK